MSLLILRYIRKILVYLIFLLLLLFQTCKFLSCLLKFLRIGVVFLFVWFSLLGFLGKLLTFLSCFIRSLWRSTFLFRFRLLRKWLNLWLLNFTGIILILLSRLSLLHSRKTLIYLIQFFLLLFHVIHLLNRLLRLLNLGRLIFADIVLLIIKNRCNHLLIFLMIIFAYFIFIIV